MCARDISARPGDLQRVVPSLHRLLTFFDPCSWPAVFDTPDDCGFALGSLCVKARACISIFVSVLLIVPDTLRVPATEWQNSYAKYFRRTRPFDDVTLSGGLITWGLERADRATVTYTFSGVGVTLMIRRRPERRAQGAPWTSPSLRRPVRSVIRPEPVPDQLLYDVSRSTRDCALGGIASWAVSSPSPVRDAGVARHLLDAWHDTCARLAGQSFSLRQRRRASERRGQTRRGDRAFQSRGIRRNDRYGARDVGRPADLGALAATDRDLDATRSAVRIGLSFAGAYC